MAKSLQEQLLAAGAVDKSRATKLKKQKHKQGKQRARGAGGEDESKVSAEAARIEKAARDRALSREQQKIAEEKAIAAQVRQLIETNIIEIEEGEATYNFSDASKVKKLNVSDTQHKNIVDGRLAIARLEKSYVLIPPPVAVKIMERDANSILVLNTGTDEAQNIDDEYAEYQIPDDLTW